MKIEVFKTSLYFKHSWFFERYIFGSIIRKTDVPVLACCNQLLIFIK